MIALIIESAIRSLALGFAVWLVLAIARPRNAHIQKMVWTSVLVASLALPFLLRIHVAPVIVAPELALTLYANDHLQTARSSAWSWISLVYVVVGSALLFRSVLGLWQMWRIRRSAHKLNEAWAANIDVRVSSEIHGPATFGSTILLPAEFAEWHASKLAAVLSHERAHVFSRDCQVLWLARLHCCFFWFNPLAWWIQRRLAILAETTSDDAALATLADHSAYAAILLEFANCRPTSTLATSMARPKISVRIERIISGIAPSSIPKLSRRMLILAALLPAVIAAAVPLQTATSSEQSSSLKPHVVSWPELTSYYPEEAKRSGTEGAVDISVTLDPEGRPTDTLILSEYPPNEGFGAAASATAHQVKYANPTGRTVQLKLHVKFALTKDASDGSADSATP